MWGIEKLIQHWGNIRTDLTKGQTNYLDGYPRSTHGEMSIFFTDYTNDILFHTTISFTPRRENVHIVHFEDRGDWNTKLNTVHLMLNLVGYRLRKLYCWTLLCFERYYLLNLYCESSSLCFSTLCLFSKTCLFDFTWHSFDRFGRFTFKIWGKSLCDGEIAILQPDQFGLSIFLSKRNNPI